MFWYLQMQQNMPVGYFWIDCCQTPNPGQTWEVTLLSSGNTNNPQFPHKYFECKISVSNFICIKRKCIRDMKMDICTYLLLFLWYHQIIFDNLVTPSDSEDTLIVYISFITLVKGFLDIWGFQYLWLLRCTLNVFTQNI